ncbi:hypothetical protein J8I87_08675, partial [Paraburkholderia sp. LEh10]|uniref:hypothetical protein n=1 Tax=Paraburkholderia sp. LEh10 TaxID=2821353 RepID=UPI001AEA174E
GGPKTAARSPSSTHTYRLLIFKEHSLKGAVLRCFFASPSFGEAELCGGPWGLSSTYFATHEISCEAPFLDT